MLHLVLALSVQMFSHMSVTDAENAALAHSPDVAGARAKVVERQANVTAARLAIGPQLVYNYTQAPQLGADNVTSAAQRTTTVGAQVTLGDLFAYSPALAQASALLGGARADEANAERVERTAAISLYYQALSAVASQHAREAAVDEATRDEHAAELRFKNGDAPRLDLVRASVAVAQAQAELARAQAESANARQALALETGVDETGLATQEVPASLLPPMRVDVTAAIDLAMHNRPEIASAQANVAAEEHAASIARLGTLPNITISGGYARGTDTGVKISGPSVSVNATLPIGQTGIPRAAAEQARLDQARAQLEKLQRLMTLEVSSAVRSYLAQTLAEDAAERALAQADDARKATEIGYRSGASSSLDLESARSTYVQTLVAAISAYYAEAQSRATLDLLMGKV